MRFRYLIALAASLLWTAAGPPASAQDVQRIAAIVNDDVISGYDVEQRVELVIRSTRMTDTPDNRRRLRARVLELLIDEKLQLQAAQRQNVAVTDEDMQNAIRQIEQQNRLAPGTFDEFARRMGVNRDSLLQQIRARLAWNKVVLRNMPPILDEEIDDAVGRASANVGKPQFRISEIFIPIDSPARDEQARQAAEDLLGQIKGRVPFEAAAREFSRGATAAEGGAVGWVMADQVDPDVSNVLKRLQVGEISEPVRTNAGYYLIRLDETRKFGADGPIEPRLALRQVMFNLPDGAGEAETQAALENARAFAAKVGDCGGLEAAAAAAEDADYVDLGRLTVGQLAAAVQEAVRALPDETMSDPVVTPVGVMLLMVCGREEPQQPEQLLNREAIEQDLRLKRMSQVAQRNIRDLRRDAVVEYR